MATPKMSATFPKELIPDLVNLISGKSSVAKLSAQKPVSFIGNQLFTFNMDAEVNVVGESAAHAAGGVTIAPVSMAPVKVEYGARVSREFLTASEEERVNLLETFNAGFAAKLAAGLDKMVFHGINPRTNTTSSLIGANHIDAKASSPITYAEATFDANLEAAITAVEAAGYTVNGIAISTTGRGALAKMAGSRSGDRKYPEFSFGAAPATLGGQALDVNNTVFVNVTGAKDHAIVGDFQNMLRWGFAQDIETKVIEYGDPDNTNKDLQGQDEVYLRATAYIGWAIFGTGSFQRVAVTGA